jgi:hypothetical protein
MDVLLLLMAAFSGWLLFALMPASRTATIDIGVFEQANLFHHTHTVMLAYTEAELTQRVKHYDEQVEGLHTNKVKQIVC